MRRGLTLNSQSELCIIIDDWHAGTYFLYVGGDYPPPNSAHRDVTIPSPATINSFMSSPGQIPFTSPNVRLVMALHTHTV